MQINPKFRVKYGENIGVELFIEFPDISGNATFINTDVASGVSSFTVDNGLKFSTDQYILVGNKGAEKSELLRTHASTTPTATTITLSSASIYAHSRGEKIQFIPYNQIVVERSTDGGTTYAEIADSPVNIRTDSETTYYNYAAGTSTDYYRVRFKNEADTSYSQYSDELIATGYVDNSVGSIIRKVLIMTGEKIDNEVLTKEFLYEALNELRREIDEHKNIIRWSFRTAFDYDAGNIIPGQYKITLPADLRYPSTNENILSVRLGRNFLPLDYKDKSDIDNYYRNVAHTTLNGDITAISTSIILTSSGDFDESGSIDIAAEAVSGTIDNILYTANNESTNVLSGATVIADNHTSGVDVWQGASFGTPMYYTVDNGTLIFNCPFSDDLASKNIWLNYYKKITDINSDGDLLDEPFYHIYIPGLKWKIKAKKDASLQINTDQDFIMWNTGKENQVLKNYTGQIINLNIG